MQLSIFKNDFKKVNDFKVKSLVFKNYKRIHGETVLNLSPGVTIITPDHNSFDDMTDVDTGLDFNPMEQHVDTLCQNDLLEMLSLLRGERDYDLWDYSFFADDGYVSAGVVMEDGSHFERRLKYRGVERLGIYKGKRFSKLKGDEIKDFRKRMKDIAIFPFDYPSFNPSGNLFEFAFSEYPFLSLPQLKDDFNFLTSKYGIKSHVNEDGSVSGKFDKLSEITLLISIENQLNHSVVLISHAFKSIHINGLEFIKLLVMLREFKKQVVFMYDNPLDLTDWYNLYDFTRKNPSVYQMTWFNEKHKEDWENVTIKIAARELIERQEMDLDDKIKKSKSIIRKAIMAHDNLAIGVSYGKDSMVMLDLVKRTVDELNDELDHFFRKKGQEPEKVPYPKIVFSDTEVEFPEHYTFINEQELLLRKAGFEIHHTNPETSFFKIVKDKGFPMFGKAIREKSHPDLYHKIKDLGIKTCGNTCCEQLKEIPSAKLYKELGVDLVFVGLLAAESKVRRERWYALGDIYYNKTEGHHKALPIIHFKEEDIYAYSEQFDVPMSPLYSIGYWKENKDGEEEYVTYSRTGCWPCSMNIQFSGNNMEMLRNTHPNLWELIMVKKGLGKEIYKFKHGINELNWSSEATTILEGYLKVKPCHFDHV